MYTQNQYKGEQICKHGVGWQLPLFDEPRANNQTGTRNKKIPDWIWSGNGIKAEVYHKMKDKFAEDSLDYLEAVIQLGGNATDHEVKAFFNNENKWPLHIVSARRNYFKNKPFYIITSYPGKVIIGPKGKQNTIWFIDFSKLKMIVERG